MRILVTVSPQMYREAIALFLRQRRPGYEVRFAAPEDVELEVWAFRPHMLVRNDTDGVGAGVLGGVPCWIEVLYSDSMDAKVSADGYIEENRDISTDELLRVADEAAARVREG